MYFDIEEVLKSNLIEDCDNKKEVITEMISILDEIQLTEVISFLRKPFFTKKLEGYLISNHLPPIESEEFLFLIQAAKYNGNIAQKTVRKSGLSNYYIKNFVNKYNLTEIGKGLFVFPNKEVDAQFLFQQQYSKSAVSHESALYMLGLSDIIPLQTSMSMPKDYNLSQLIQSKNNNINIFETHNTNTGKELILEYIGNDPIVVKRNEKIATNEINTKITKNGNQVRVTSAERTIADILKQNSFVEEEIKEMAIIRYFKEPYSNVTKLRRIAKGQKVLKILDEYLWNLKLH